MSGGVEMYIAGQNKLLKIWRYAFDQNADVILMRHAPKSGSDGSDLSEEGENLATQYGLILNGCFSNKKYLLACTSKNRTSRTLRLMFPFSDPLTYLHLPDLEVNKVTPFVQDQVNKIHKEAGCFRGYYLNHTYYFLEELGGRFDEENIHTALAERMARGIKSLFELKTPIIYCGHSPSIEVGCKKLLGVTLSELGGFLNPLDSIHLKAAGDKIEWVARINPIADYVDLESETYFK